MPRLPDCYPVRLHAAHMSKIIWPVLSPRREGSAVVASLIRGERVRPRLDSVWPTPAPVVFPERCAERRDESSQKTNEITKIKAVYSVDVVSSSSNQAAWPPKAIFLLLGVG